MALPLEVFEDRKVPAAQAGGGSAALSMSISATGQDRSPGNVPTPASSTGAQHKRHQAQVSSAPQSLAGSVMLLRSRQPSTLQLPPSYPASAAKHDTGRSEELGLPDVLLSPPSPRSMQILGKSRGLKRDRLDFLQPTPPAKRPALAPNPGRKPTPRKGKAAVPGLAVSPPQTAQPVGSNWWSQGPAAQPGLVPHQLAPSTQGDMAPSHSRGGHPSLSGTQYMQLSGQRDSASWQPGYPSSPPVPYRAYTTGNEHIPNDGPAWAPSSEQEDAGAWHSSPPVSRRSTMPAKQAMQQPSRQPVPERPGTGAIQQPQTVRYKGKMQDMQMQDLVNEVLAQDTPACWMNGSTRKQHSRAGAPSRIQDIHSPTLRAGGQGPGQRVQTCPQPEQSWPAPEGGRYILASPPASKMQQPKTRSTQAERKDQHLGQHHSAMGSLENGCVVRSPLHLSPCMASTPWFLASNFLVPGTALATLQGRAGAACSSVRYWISCTHKYMLCRHATPAGYPQALQGSLRQLHTEVERFATMAAPTVVRSANPYQRSADRLSAAPMLSVRACIPQV